MCLAVGERRNVADLSVVGPAESLPLPRERTAIGYRETNGIPVKSDEVRYRLNDAGEFVAENYNCAQPFANFLPGIAGPHGIPMWLFYVNRGQCVCGMGTRDKEHPIMEFLSANRAYQLTSRQGFRTFLKLRRGESSMYYEPFQRHAADVGMDRDQRMIIGSSTFSLEEENRTIGMRFRIDYFTVPEDSFAGLVRVLRVENTGRKPVGLQLLDGLPLIVPYGVDNYNLKNMRNLVESFVEVTNLDRGVPLFKGKTRQEDRPDVARIQEGHFYLGFREAKREVEIIRPIVDPRLIFGTRTDYEYPEAFVAARRFGTDAVQRLENCLPTAMGFSRTMLSAGASHTYCSIIGQVENRKTLNRLVRRCATPSYVEAKRRRNRDIVERIKQTNFTCGSSGEFDLYCRQNLLDNILRGGLPVTYEGRGKRTTVHLYSRKHGDPERDYNAFILSPTNYSQGAGNYRDVNQNRRCDLFINPDVREANVRHFYNLLQLDGFNPLAILPSAFVVSDGDALNRVLKSSVSSKNAPVLKELLADEFTPGDLFARMNQKGIKLRRDPKRFLGDLLAISDRVEKARTFARGWLENESIWLHMEYKYMLELLRAGLHREFYSDFKKVLVPFMDPKQYGRSILENSSFIVSSANPDPKIHGRGFAARLSGSTAEFVHILSVITAGWKPFSVNRSGQLDLQFRPVLPAWLFTKTACVRKLYSDKTEIERDFRANTFSFMFLGEILVTYNNPLRKDTYGQSAVCPVHIRITERGGGTTTIEGPCIPADWAHRIRDRKVQSITIDLA